MRAGCKATRANVTLQIQPCLQECKSRCEEEAVDKRVAERSATLRNQAHERRCGVRERAWLWHFVTMQTKPLPKHVAPLAVPSTVAKPGLHVKLQCSPLRPNVPSFGLASHAVHVPAVPTLSTMHVWQLLPQAEVHEDFGAWLRSDDMNAWDRKRNNRNRRN